MNEGFTSLNFPCKILLSTLISDNFEYRKVSKLLRAGFRISHKHTGVARTQHSREVAALEKQPRAAPLTPLAP